MTPILFIVVVNIHEHTSSSSGSGGGSQAVTHHMLMQASITGADSLVEIQQDCLDNAVFSFLSNVAKESGLSGKYLTSFSEFQIFDAGWLNALDENLVRAARDSKRLREEHSGWTGL